MLDWQEFIKNTIQEFAKENSLQLENIDDWVFYIYHNSKKIPLFGHDPGLNSSAVVDVCKDKSSFSKIMQKANLPAIEHKLLLKPGSVSAPENTYELAFSYFSQCSNKAIIKPNSSSAGEDVYFVSSKEELTKTLDRLFEKHRAINISCFVEAISEYRVSLLDCKAEFVYKKLSRDWKFNLSSHAKAQVPNKKDKKATRAIKLAQSACKALGEGARFLHIDLLEKKDGSLVILEANSAVMFLKFLQQLPEYEKEIKQIYKKAYSKLIQ